MSADFGTWFSAQGAKMAEEIEEDEKFCMTCSGCGKSEYITLSEYESGDKGWYSNDIESGVGVCGGSQWCAP